MGIYTDFEAAIMQSVMAAVVPVQPVSSLASANLPITARNMSGFAGQARVATAFGDVAVEALRVGDHVRTFAGKMVRVGQIEKVTLNADTISAHPIKISAHAFGSGRPMQALTVLPGQEIGVDSHAATHFKTANELSSKPGMQRVKFSGQAFYRIQCEETVTVKVEGVWVRVGL